MSHIATAEGRTIYLSGCQILIGAYNKLRTDEYREKAMDLFDMMLKDRAYKQYGLKMLAEHDRG